LLAALIGALLAWAATLVRLLQRLKPDYDPLANNTVDPRGTGHVLRSGPDALAPDILSLKREQIGDRLLPFALRRSPAISEALAEGMTVIDYAPTATVAEDYAHLAEWVRSLSAPATQSYRGVRWSER